jgi:hypothetical protein
MNTSMAAQLHAIATATVGEDSRVSHPLRKDTALVVTTAIAAANRSAMISAATMYFPTPRPICQGVALGRLAGASAATAPSLRFSSIELMSAPPAGRTGAQPLEYRLDLVEMELSTNSGTPEAYSTAPTPRCTVTTLGAKHLIHNAGSPDFWRVRAEEAEVKQNFTRPNSRIDFRYVFSPTIRSVFPGVTSTRYSLTLKQLQAVWHSGQCFLRKL